MSSTVINFSTTLIIGEQEVPLLSEIVIGDSNSQDGLENGFIFKLDRDESDPPVTVYLGDIIGVIENNLGVGDLSQNPGMQLITDAFAGVSPPINSETFNESNQALVDIYEFTLNSSASETLFSFNIDIEGSDPNTGLIALPEAFSSWMKIESISISFSATTKS